LPQHPALTGIEPGLHLVGDVRLDDGDSLREQLDVAALDGTAIDEASLVLHAWRRWGRACVERFTGDFAFAIYDAPARTLFCARDPFGVKPFYYSTRPGVFVFSSALRAVLAYPGVTDALDEVAIRDFLLFSLVIDPERTTFSDVRTLPAGHTLEWRSGQLEVRRWWTMPLEAPFAPRKDRDLVEEFNALLSQAVRARLAPRVAVSLSGGLDSSAIATVASEAGAHVLAQTIVFAPLVPDDEERYARAVAERIGAQHEITRADEHRLFEQWDDPAFVKTEPSSDPFSAITTSQFRRAARQTSVMLAGQGGDVAFYTSHPYFFNLLRSGRVDRFGREVLQFVLRNRRLPPLCLRSSFRRWRGVRPQRPPFPAWIHARPEDIERWRGEWNDLPEIHPTRPQAYALLSGVGWPRLFEYTDPAAMGSAIEYRNPFFDMRLLRFLFRVPPMPWFAEKHLLREAMKGRLPEAVRTRRKKPIGMDPAHVWMTRQADELSRSLAACNELDRWVDRDEAERAMRSRSRSLYDSFLLCLPLSLAQWLRSGIGHSSTR
jgi:asparagine synthase (glutamine-hydrolysing)